MYVQPRAWEGALLALAREAVTSVNTAVHTIPAFNQGDLGQAFAYCESMTARHSRSFHMASSLLPPPKRRAVRALYAFCRVTDDLIDNNPGDQAAALLNRWRNEALLDHPDDADPVAVAWADTRLRYHVPQRYAEQLLDGVARDLTQTRYDTFADLATYCYGVASTVGLMSMHIIGYADEDAIPYAIKLGLALQLTNILRDIAEDWQRGRLYLPREELAAFGLDEETLNQGRVDDKWRSFMRFQIARNRQLYREAWSGIGLLSPDGRFSIAAAASLYRAILSDIEAHDFDVFSRRAFVGQWGKIRRLPGIWWQSRQLGT